MVFENRHKCPLVVKDRIKALYETLYTWSNDGMNALRRMILMSDKKLLSKVNCVCYLYIK